MIAVYYRKVFSHLEEDAFFRLLGKVEAGRRERLLKMKGKEQQMCSLAAGCLLHDAESWGSLLGTGTPSRWHMVPWASPICPGTRGFILTCPIPANMCVVRWEMCLWG